MKKNRPFNVMLNDVEFEQLTQIAEKTSLSKGAAIRQLIGAGYLMQVHGAPTCANGQNCFVPHLHPPQKLAA